MDIYVVTEEVEDGSFKDGTTYCIISAFRTERAADDAVDAWRKEHQETCGTLDEAWADTGWCPCGTGATIDTVRLED